MEEAVAAVDLWIDARADYEHCGFAWVRSDVSEHLHALQRGGTDRFGDLGGHGGKRVEHLDCYFQYARRLDGSHAGGQRRTEDHRDLASDFARKPDANHLLNSVHQLRQLGLAFDDDGQGPALPLVVYVLPWDEVDVLHRASKVLQFFFPKRRKERNRGQLFESEHNCLPSYFAGKPPIQKAAFACDVRNSRRSNRPPHTQGGT